MLIRRGARHCKHWGISPNLGRILGSMWCYIRTSTVRINFLAFISARNSFLSFLTNIAVFQLVKLCLVKVMSLSFMAPKATLTQFESDTNLGSNHSLLQPQVNFELCVKHWCAYTVIRGGMPSFCRNTIEMHCERLCSLWSMHFETYFNTSFKLPHKMMWRATCWVWHVWSRTSPSTCSTLDSVCGRLGSEFSTTWAASLLHPSSVHSEMRTSKLSTSTLSFLCKYTVVYCCPTC